MIKKIMNNEDAGTVMLSEVLEAVTVDSVMDMLLMADDGFPTVSILFLQVLLQTLPIQSRFL